MSTLNKEPASRAHVSLVPSYPHLRARLWLRTMVKKVPACYGIRKGRGAPVVVHSWAEVVAKVSERARLIFSVGSSPPRDSCFVFAGQEGGEVVV